MSNCKDFVSMFLWLSGRALCQQCKDRVPGNTHTDNKCIAWMHCKSLWIKASAKCINVNANALQISSSTVHNIIKRFREAGEISACKGQGRRPLLDARGLRALRRHCITHRRDSVIDIKAIVGHNTYFSTLCCTLHVLANISVIGVNF